MAANSAVRDRICLKFELIRDVMVALVTFKNENDPITKKFSEPARMKIESKKAFEWPPQFSHHTCMWIYQDAQGQLTP